MKRALRAAIVVALITPFAAGCAIKPMTASTDSVTAFQGQGLTVVTYEPKAAFLQMTFGTAGLGAIGGAAMAITSQNIVTEYNLINPAILTADLMKPVLNEKFKPATLNAVSDAADSAPKSLPDLSAMAGHKGLVFDVQGNVLSAYFPFDWTHYKVTFYGEGRLVDASTGKSVAQARCEVDSSNEKDPAVYIPNAPTYDALYANGAELLKATFAKASQACVLQMRKTMFGN